MLREEEGRPRNNAGQLINAEGYVILDVIVVAGMDDFDLSRLWYDGVGKDPFQGFPHQDPRNNIAELEYLVSRSEQNEVSEYHMLCKIFPYSISGDAFRWFSQLQLGSLSSWDEIERSFLYKFLDDAEATREKEKNDNWDKLMKSCQMKSEDMVPTWVVAYCLAKCNEQHMSGELSRVEEAGTEDATSMSIDNTISTSTDITTSTSINGTTSESIAHTIPASIDGDSCFRSIPLEIPERSSSPQDIADSAHKSTDVSSCSPSPDVEKGITMEDSLEREEILELEDGEKLEDLDSSREVTMEYFLELEEWHEDMDQNLKKKLDNDQHTSRGDLETLKASIVRYQPDEIDRQPPHIIDLRHPTSIDTANHLSIDTTHLISIDAHC
ncbi:hypothetical protein DY000_02042040 [Brassica cretica]|uniref:Retrotransposon gag domain-containing protein n=1 Tax=Brassica cretica TaxID=69181 RepID=A0ABQ7BGF7_BRACR|nr:hypothetical protein DY000_02042040 [Brassica cretica]